MEDERLSDHWERGDPYEQYIGRWSRQVAARFLSWIDRPAGLRWLDVGCGTGALCAAVADRCAPARISGVEPSAGFLRTAGEHLAGRAGLYRASATHLPFADASVDVVVSGLVLNFVADPAAALREMARVTGNAGLVAAYVWDYAEKMQLIRFFWDAAVELDPGAARLDEGARFPLCRPDRLAALFAAAGFREIEVTAIDILTPFASFAAYWQPLLGGQGPVPAYVMALDSAARARLHDSLRARLPTHPDGSITLIARAWAVRAAAGR